MFRRFTGIEASLGDLGALTNTHCHATDTSTDAGRDNGPFSAISPLPSSQSLSAPLTPAQWSELLRRNDMRLIVGIYSSWCEPYCAFANRSTKCLFQNQRRSLHRVCESHAIARACT